MFRLLWTREWCHLRGVGTSQGTSLRCDGGARRGIVRLLLGLRSVRELERLYFKEMCLKSKSAKVEDTH